MFLEKGSAIVDEDILLQTEVSHEVKVLAGSGLSQTALPYETVSESIFIPAIPNRIRQKIIDTKIIMKPLIL